MPLTDRKNIKYVYQLPYSERMQLCRILDMNDKWEILGKLTDIDDLTKVTIQNIVYVRQGKSSRFFINPGRLGLYCLLFYE